MKMLFAALLITFSVGAQAEPLLRTFAFLAQISWLGNANMLSTLESSEGANAGTTVKKGDMVVGSFTYDMNSQLLSLPGEPPRDVSVTTPGYYMYGGLGSKNHLTFTILPSGQRFDSAGHVPGPGVTINQDYSAGDSFTMQGSANISGGVAFKDSSGLVFSNGMIPDTLNLAAFDMASVTSSWLRPSDNHFIMMAADILALFPANVDETEVPEPGNVALFFAGIAILAFSVRRRRRQ